MDGEKRAADLSNAKIKGYLNHGKGMRTEGVGQSESGIVYEYGHTAESLFPMFALDFSEYLAAEEIRMRDVQKIELCITIYDEGGNEIDLSDEFQKCALVSRDALDGYSSSDILPSGSYKTMGSGVVTTIDLTKYTGFEADGKTPLKKNPEDAVGINIQILNGDFKQMSYLAVSNLTFFVEETADLVADLSDGGIAGYVNRGYGTSDDGVSRSDAGIEFEMVYSEFAAYPMFAVDFSDYLASKDINVEDVESFHLTAAIYDKDRKEIDLSEEYQKCAFVSREALNGYSDSDILPTGNYKRIGSNLKTVFDLTTYTGYKGDESGLTDSVLEDGVGFNLQIVNGDRTDLRYLVISRLGFNMKKDA